MKRFLVLVPVVALVLAACGPSEREVDLQNQLEKTEKRLEKTEERLANTEEKLATAEQKAATVTSELAAAQKREEIQAQKELEELKKQQSKIKIDGTAFVKTKGGENFKLALIPIGVSTLEEYEAACVAVLSDIASTRTKHTPLLEKNRNQIKPLGKQKAAEFALWKPIEAKRYALVKKHKGRPYQIWESLNRISVYGGSYNGAKAIEAEYNSYVRQANIHYEKWEALDDEHTSLLVKNNGMLMEETSKLRNRMRTVIKLLQANGAQTRSDADGKFSVELDREKDYVLTGYGERKAGDSTEVYNWIVEINISRDEKNSEVFFSNSELAESVQGDQEAVALVQVRNQNYGIGLRSFGDYCHLRKEIKVDR